MLVITELSEAPDVQMREVMTDKYTHYQPQPHYQESQDSPEGLPVLASVSLIVLASLVVLLLSVLAAIFYYKYQKRKLKQPLKAIDRFAVQSLICPLDDIS